MHYSICILRTESIPDIIEKLTELCQKDKPYVLISQEDIQSGKTNIYLDNKLIDTYNPHEILKYGRKNKNH